MALIAVSFLEALAPHGVDHGHGTEIPGLAVRPPPSFINITVTVTAAAVVVFAVAIVAVVVVVVAGQPLAVQGSTVDLASALGGKAFAQDVVKVAVRRHADAIIEGIRQGRVPLPAGTTEQQAVGAIEAILRRHLP